MNHLLKFFKDRLIRILLILGTTSLIIGFSIQGVEYLQAKDLITESKQLSNIGKYKEAINKLTTAQSKWSTQDIKDEIRADLIINKELSESSENFEIGLIQYDGGNYEIAIEYFEKVIKENIKYDTARTYIEIAQKKIDDEEENKNVVGVSTQKINNISQQYNTTQFFTPTPTIRIEPTENPNKDSICKNEAELGKIKFQDDAWKIAREKMPVFFSWEEAKKTNPWRSESNPDDPIIFQEWLKFSKIQTSLINEGIKNEGQKLYYQLYNACLKK